MDLGSDEYGQLGNGGIINTSLNTPTQVDLATNWQKVYAGPFNTFAIKQDGTLWGCGRNNLGQLGDGTTTNRNTFVQVGTSADWSAISVGKYFTVGIKTDGTLWTWGDNYYGQLGDGTNVGKFVPTKIGNATDWQIIACGPEHVVAQKTSGTVWAWGNGQNGALGINNDANFNIPKLVNITNLLSVSCGYYLSLVIKNDNKLYAWGTNVSSQFGNGTNVSSLIPIEVSCPAFMGVSETKADNLSINAYPNPTSDFLNIDYKLHHNSHVLIRLVNCQGQLISEYKSDKKNGNNSDKITLENQPAGLYFLTFSSDGDGNPQTIKIAKSRP